MAASNVSYKFTLWLANPIPQKAVVYVTFPSSWPLDCSAALPGVYCQAQDRCQFQNSRVSCDPITNSYRLDGGFDNIYVVPPGPVTFSLTNLTNPPSTLRKYFAVTTFNQDGLLYIIDYSNQLFSLEYRPGVV